MCVAGDDVDKMPTEKRKLRERIYVECVETPFAVRRGLGGKPIARPHGQNSRSL